MCQSLCGRWSVTHATIDPKKPPADPVRLVPYIDMVFSPTIVPWLCLTAVKETLSDMGTVDEVRAFAHLPVIESAELAGCPRPKFWDDWFDHQQDDAYWRGLSIERRLGRRCDRRAICRGRTDMVDGTRARSSCAVSTGIRVGTAI